MTPLPCHHSEVLMHPEVPQALRLQALLTGGVVVIQHRQVSYLLDDCTDVLVGRACPGCTRTPVLARAWRGIDMDM